MTLLRYLMRTVLYLRYLFHKISRTGSFGPNQAKLITKPAPRSKNPIKDGLVRHHVKQFHESSCSVASVASVVNTLMAAQGILNGTPVSQQDLLETVSAAHWKERMGPNGYKGRRGLPLPVLGQVVEASLKTFGIRYHSVDVVRAERSRNKAPAIRKNCTPGWKRSKKGCRYSHCPF